MNKSSGAELPLLQQVVVMVVTRWKGWKTPTKTDG